MSPLLSTLANASALGYRSLVAGAATSFESIATVSVGSGGASSIDFTSIPGTYSHLQIRSIAKTTAGSTNDYAVLFARFNGDTASNYALHELLGNGASVSAGAGTSQTLTYAGYSVKTNPTNTFAGNITDILDYANTNKNKTIRTLGGLDTNSTVGVVYLHSGLWMSTSAITSIKLYDPSNNNFAQYSHFALYGIKGVA